MLGDQGNMPYNDNYDDLICVRLPFFLHSNKNAHMCYRKATYGGNLSGSTTEVLLAQKQHLAPAEPTT
jgi:hypothetical protein